MQKYVEGVVENIERRGFTKSLTLELSGKNRIKDVIFFEDVVSIRSNDGALHSVRVEDDNAVSIGEQIFLFKNEEDVAVKIYKEKENLHEDLEFKDKEYIVNHFLAFITFTMSISLFIIVLLLYIFDGQNYINTIFGGSIGFSGIISAVFCGYYCREYSLREMKRRNSLKNMVADFRESQAEQGVEVSQEANVIVR